jgi:hypothetical protein
MRKAPKNSVNTAIQQACTRVKVFDPTEEANELATSFAPMPKAVIKKKSVMTALVEV